MYIDTHIFQDTANWFKSAKPEATDRDFETQLGVHCEEIHEMLEELSAISSHGVKLLEAARHAMHKLASELKAGTADVILHPGDRLLFLDSLCDQIVTATGTGVLAKMNIVGGLNEVNRSNWSKFGEDGKPILNENGKIMKGPNYSPADLTPFI